MSRVIKEKFNDELSVTLVSGSGDERGCVITISSSIAPMILPEYLVEKSGMITETHPKIDFSSKPKRYRIKDQTYVGTVASLSNDAMVDLYYISNDYKDDEGTTKTERYMIVIPSLSILEDAGSLDSKVPLKIKGSVVFVENVGTVSQTQTTSYKIDIKDSVAVQPVLNETNEMKDISELVTKTISLPGLFFAVGTFTNVTRYIPNIGEVSSVGADDMPGQVIVLGDVGDIFTDVSDLTLPLTRIRPVDIRKYVVDAPRKVKISSGVLAIPLIF